MSARPTVTARPPAQRVLPRGLVPTALAWSALGLVASAYLTYEHLTGSTTLACPEGATVNCAKVTSSQWSSFLGLPVAPLGLLFFVAMLALCLPSVMHRSSARLDALRLGFCGVGLALAIYLLWAELFQIHAICLWCTAVHVLTFLLFVTLLFGLVLAEPASTRPLDDRD